MAQSLRIGVYVDGFNLYYGAKGLCGPDPGWKWLDIRVLAQRLLDSRRDQVWKQAAISNIVFCTARVSGRDDPTSPRDQDMRLKALQKSGSVDKIEYGNYVETVIERPLATRGKNGKPVLSVPRKFVQVADREEKASDVNVAAHLLVDMLRNKINGAMVISNDSDLRLPLRIARETIRVATVNPSIRDTVGHLKGEAADGIGGHWWHQMTEEDVRACQLPSPVGRIYQPPNW